jgi:hypothetical protein
MTTKTENIPSSTSSNLRLQDFLPEYPYCSFGYRLRSLPCEGKWYDFCDEHIPQLLSIGNDVYFHRDAVLNLLGNHHCFLRLPTLLNPLITWLNLSKGASASPASSPVMQRSRLADKGELREAQIDGSHVGIAHAFRSCASRFRSRFPALTQ